MKYLPIFLFLLSLLLECFVVNIPLVLVNIIALVVIKKNYQMFLLGFLLGIFLDILSFRTVGVSSLFFITLIFLTLLYEKKFEITTNYFVIIASFIGSFVFIFINHLHNLFLSSIISMLLGLMFFNIYKKIYLIKKEENG